MFWVYFNIDLQDDLVNDMMATTTKEAEREVGKLWLIQQAKELKKQGVPCLHFYTMSNSTIIQDIIKEL